MTPSILVIGFPKSGTTSIHHALESAGFRSVHWELPNGEYCGEVIYRAVREGKDPLAYLSEYDAITQMDICLPRVKKDGRPLNYWPQLDFELLDEIERHHPGIRFILNRRDPERLIKSMSRWHALRRRLLQARVPGLPRFRPLFDRDLRRWITGHYDACRARYGDRETFLDLDIERPDAREALEEFLGVAVPWWGVANANPVPSETTPVRL